MKPSPARPVAKRERVEGSGTLANSNPRMGVGVVKLDLINSVPVVSIWMSVFVMLSVKKKDPSGAKANPI